jgi:hypothetical protein
MFSANVMVCSAYRDFQGLVLKWLGPPVTLLQEKQFNASVIEIHMIKYHIHPNTRQNSSSEKWGLPHNHAQS